MHPSSRRHLATWLVAAAALTTGRGALAQSTGQSAAARDTVRRGYTEADVRFMQGMIHHHAQALVMAALVPERTTSESMRLLAERITVSQRDEIAFMRRWLASHGETAPDPTASHAMHDMPGMAMADSTTMMPGMLTAAQLDTLAAAKGAAFERLFLQGMIRHHEGALTMVARLFASPGAAQDGEVFRFASDVDTDQRAEIARMRALLAAMPNR